MIFFPNNPPWFFKTNVDKFQLKYSQIHGLGVFAKENILNNEIVDTICPIKIPNFVFYIATVYYLFRKLFTKKTDNFLKFLFLIRENFRIKEVYILPSLFSYCNDAIKIEKANAKIVYEKINKIYYVMITKDVNANEEILIKYE